MAKESGIVYVRMDAELKEAAEAILDQLGISASGAVQMLYRQIIINRGLPFELKLFPRPDSEDDYTEKETIQMLQHVIDEMDQGKFHTLEESKRSFNEMIGRKKWLNTNY